MWRPRTHKSGGQATAWHRLRTALKQVVGMPDYARYLAHRQEHHPACPILTEREFYDQYLAVRYGGGATRCC